MRLHEAYETHTLMSLGTHNRLDKQYGVSLRPRPAFVVTCREMKKKEGEYDD